MDSERILNLKMEILVSYITKIELEILLDINCIIWILLGINSGIFSKIDREIILKIGSVLLISIKLCMKGSFRAEFCRFTQYRNYNTNLIKKVRQN